MKRVLRRTGYLLIVAAVVASNLVLNRATIVRADAVRQIPTRIDSTRTPADITIAGSLSRVVGTGDFNGDGFGDILVGNSAVAYVFFGGPVRAPEIKKAKYRTSTSELLITGTDLTGAARVEVNGVLVDREVTFDPVQGRIVLQGHPSELALKTGKNKIVVVRKGARSNTAKLKL